MFDSGGKSKAIRIKTPEKPINVLKRASILVILSSAGQLA